MDNKDNIEVLDDFDLDEPENIHSENISNNVVIDNVIEQQLSNSDIVQNNDGKEEQDTNINNDDKIKTELPNTSHTESKNQNIDNPVVEMINNKSTMRLILIMLIVLFIAVLGMPKVFELIRQ